MSEAMTQEGMIEITGADLTEAVKAAYNLSRPQGLGMLHYTPEPLSDHEAACLVQDGPRPVSLDYVKGRACKFNVRRDEDGRLWIRDTWFDHTEADLSALLDCIGIDGPDAA